MEYRIIAELSHVTYTRFVLFLNNFQTRATCILRGECYDLCSYLRYILNLTIFNLDSKYFTLQENPWLDPVLERKLLLAQKVHIHLKTYVKNKNYRLGTVVKEQEDHH